MKEDMQGQKRNESHKDEMKEYLPNKSNELTNRTAGRICSLSRGKELRDKSGIGPT